MTDSEKIINELNKFGYDCFINNNLITILYDGFTKTIPLDNTIKLLYNKQIPMKMNELIQHLISMHTMAKDIKDGKFDNAEPIPFSRITDLIREKLSYKIYDDNVNWYSTNLLDNIIDERKELLIRYFNLTQKEIKSMSNINGRFKALIFPILAIVHNQIHIDWHSDIKDIISEVNNKCINIKNDIDCEMKFVNEFSKNKVIELQLKRTLN
jgi:hypothetical protein